MAIHGNKLITLSLPNIVVKLNDNKKMINGIEKRDYNDKKGKMIQKYQPDYGRSTPPFYYHQKQLANNV